MPTVYEIAAHAQVSIATVSRVINGSAKLRPTTRQRVQNAIDELGYVPNSSAQGMARGATGIIGLIYRRSPTLTERSSLLAENMSEELVDQTRQTMTYFDALIGYLEEAAYNKGFALLLAGIPNNGSAPEVLSLSGRCDGLILADVPLADDVVSKILRQTPLVSIADGAGNKAISNVLVDNASAMETLIDHLVDTHNVRHIAYIGGPAASSDAAARSRAVVRHSAARGIRLAPLPDWQGDFSPHSAFDVVKRNCGRGAVLPDVIMCANDGMAAGALSALKDLGHRVPEDVAVTGFDDLEIAHLTAPALTTMRQPLEGLAAMAIDRLVVEIDSAGRQKYRDLVSASLVVRESCGCPKIRPPVPKRHDASA